MDDLRPVLDLARPSTIRGLWRAGAFRLRGAVGAAASLPWLLGRGPSLGIISRINAAAAGPKPAIHDRQGTLTWRDVERRSNRVARALISRGVQPGDRVATLLRNGREIVEVLIGSQKLGVTVWPLNTWAGAEELAVLVEQADPRLLVYDVRQAERLEAVVPDDVALLAVGGLGTGEAEPYESALEAAPSTPPPPFARHRAPARIVIHTSGTTGKPKGAARGAGTNALRDFAGLLGVVPFHRDDVILCPAPLFHSFGLLTGTVAFLLGATLVLPDRFDPQETLELIERHSVTACSLVPVMLRRILSLPEETRRRYDLSSARIVLVSGSAMSQDLREAATELFGDVLHDLYGSTEAGWVAIATPEEIRERPGTVGHPVPGVEVAAFSPSGKRLPPGETGELYVRSAAMFEGYVTGEESKKREGFLSLGDLGHLDQEGSLHVEGREDEMVVVGGENVYPIEVEEAVTRLDGVDDVAGIGVEDPEYGEVLAAFYTGPADPDAIREGCERALASFKVPRRVERVEELPRTATGKVRKAVLTELLGKKE
jgi:acyl-CoA synthetase (AMP-forming)/AMP-acid ligase II